jgi:hypothetical protein
MWSIDRLVLVSPDKGGLGTRNRSATRRVRLNLPSTHVPLFHAWRP